MRDNRGSKLRLARERMRRILEEHHLNAVEHEPVLVEDVFGTPFFRITPVEHLVAVDVPIRVIDQGQVGNVWKSTHLTLGITKVKTVGTTTRATGANIDVIRIAVSVQIDCQPVRVRVLERESNQTVVVRWWRKH